MNNKPKDLIVDTKFKVQINGYGSSPDPALSCWHYMHSCVSTNEPLTDKPPLNPTASIINNAITSRKHWHVLDASFLILHVSGFDHNTAMQFRTHRAHHTLVQSMRYTEIADGDDKTIDDIFYIPPYLKNSTKIDLMETCNAAIESYFDSNEKAEVKRYLLPTNYRQSFTMAGTATAWMHMFDSRLLRDTQIESQTAAWMMLDACILWWPGMFEWYRDNRAGKNMMAP
jgi:thymidylate synthase (FAD)